MNEHVIDFHSHILPAFDDGAMDEEMSLAMLTKSMEQGVGTVVSTSHCYPYSSDDIRDFVQGRTAAYDLLIRAAQRSGVSLPDIRLGSEVHLTCDLSMMSEIKRLCIDNTNYLLLEMPSRPWNDAIIDSVYKLSIKGITPIIAHMERNFIQKDDLLSQLYGLDVLIQINAESFAMSNFKKDIDKLFRAKLVHIVGSDMHNMSSRKPNMDKGRQAVIKRYGADCWSYLMNNAAKILEGGEVSYGDMRAFKKKSLFAR